MFPHPTAWPIHPHALFEGLAYLAGLGEFFWLRYRFGDSLATPIRWATFATALFGAVLGAKLLYWLEDPALTRQHIHEPAYLLGGKTIIGALLFAVLAVELGKQFIGLRQPTGDLYAIPLATGIAIGRVGCFLSGLADNTYGTPTQLPWGVDFGDGIRRHPTQIYETVFLFVLIPLLYKILQNLAKQQRAALSIFVAGDVFKFFMVTYASFRLLCDFIKPYPRIFLGLGTIQWACVAILLYYFRDILRWVRSRKRTVVNPHFAEFGTSAVDRSQN